jgi:hypothetical protein
MDIRVGETMSAAQKSTSKTLVRSGIGRFGTG